MILDYIEQAGKGKYQCFKTKKICLDSVDNDTIAYNYDDKTIANATKSTFAETDHSRVKTIIGNHRARPIIRHYSIFGGAIPKCYTRSS